MKGHYCTFILNLLLHRLIGNKQVRTLAFPAVVGIVILKVLQHLLLDVSSFFWEVLQLWTLIRLLIVGFIPKELVVVLQNFVS